MPTLNAAIRHDMTVDAVRYYEADAELPSYYGGFSPSGHNVGMGVELLFPAGHGLSLTWVNPRDVDGIGFAGYLAAVDLPMDYATPEHGLARYDVSHWPEWQPYLGSRIIQLDHIWDTEAPHRDAVKLHIDGRPPVTVALGGTDESGGVFYQIDGLVVFHNNVAARVYLDHLRKHELEVTAQEMAAALGSNRP